MHPVFILLLTISLNLLPVLGTPTPELDPITITTTTSVAQFNSSCDINCQTDTILFTFSLVQFLIARQTTTPPQLDWSSDGCTKAPDYPRGYNFLDSCYRHDFGYRNYAKQARLHVDNNRKKIDKKLKRDCYDECDRKWRLLLADKWVECRKIALVYWVGVRVFGKSKGKGNGADYKAV